MIEFKMLSPRMTAEMLGLIPEFLSARDPRPAAEQFAQNYAHGGGWSPMEVWKGRSEDHALKYPGDPWLKPRASAELPASATRRAEVVCVYDGAWVAIWQPNGEFEVSRMD